MAKKRTKRTERTGITYVGPTRQPRYPWDQWFRRRKFILRRGVDYLCQPYTMMILIRMKAAQRGMKVSVNIREDELTVTRKGAA
jgi:hypothetical protein